MNKPRHLWKASFLVLALAVGGCQGGVSEYFPHPQKAEMPVPTELVEVMREKGMSLKSPIMIRVFKEENVAEIWKKTNSERYDKLAEYEICKWSGKLGPKFKEGDRQAPEGFYTVKPWQMNPNSEYYLSFNLGFPNAYDRAHKRTGSHLMMHGACSSAGCYSMTDENIGIMFALARDALEGGQEDFQVQAFPFRMTPENMALHKEDEHFEFWKMLKEGYDHFEITRVPPKVDVCEKRYVFNQEAEEGEVFKATEECPPMAMPDSLALAYSDKLSKDEEAFRQVLKKQAIKAAWKGEEVQPEEEIKEATLATDPTAPGVTAPVTIDGERVIADYPGGVPVPTKPDRPEPEAEPKRPWGLLGWLRGGKN
ncbi:MAG: L,D-transpeptidase family protein [Rhizobiaceae bacterium]